jgi:hypothetical protein
LEIGLDEHWKHQECKYDFTANINIRSNSGSDVKSRIIDVFIQYGVQELHSCGHDVIIEAFWVKINYKEQKPENRKPSQRTVL